MYIYIYIEREREICTHTYVDVGKRCAPARRGKPATCKHGWSKHGSSIICLVKTWTI